MTHVVTVTPNPAVDITYEVDALTPGASHRVARVLERAGGKGVNVARVLQALGEPALVVAPFGGETGAWLARSLREDGLDVRPVPVAATSRRTVTVVTHGSATALNEPGRPLAPDEWSALVEGTAVVLAGASALVLSGSTPPGAPADLYPRLISAARHAGLPAVVDTSGPALLAAAEAGPALLKPNADELREAIGESDVVVAARQLVGRGAKRVVVSLGDQGLAAFSAEDAWRVPAVPGVVGNATGAGDATVAALARGLVDKSPWPGPLIDAAALGAAAVLADVAGDVDLDAYARFLPTLSAERLA